jgi:hypothetical protein
MVEALTQNAALLGAIIGFLGGIVTNALTQAFSIYKDEKIWKRERELEELRLRREEEALYRNTLEAKKEYVQSIYHNCIRFLSSLAVSQDEISQSDGDRLNVVHRTQEWLALLLLHLGENEDNEHNDFRFQLGQFTDHPSSQAASFLLDDVVKLALHDKILFPNMKPEPELDISKIDVQIDVDNEFLRQQFIAGTKLNKHHHLKVDLAKLTTSQRQILWEMYGLTIPTQLVLQIPVYDEGSGKLVWTGKTWSANFDPSSTSQEEVFNKWEDACNEVLIKNNQDI